MSPTIPSAVPAHLYSSVVRTIAERAAAATRAQGVLVLHLDPEARTLRPIAASTGMKRGLARALRQFRRAALHFDRHSLEFRADANPLLYEVIGGGLSVECTPAEATQGVLAPDLAAQVFRIWGQGRLLLRPAKGPERVYGAVCFHFDAPIPADRRPLCTLFAEQLALVAENAQLRRALSQRGADLERLRQSARRQAYTQRRELAEWLHGPVQTRLLIAAHQLRGCRERLSGAFPEVGTALAQVAEQLEELREHDVRARSHHLHPLAVRIGLIPGLRSLLGRLAADVEISLAFDAQVERLDSPRANRLPEPLRLLVYRICEQALGNVLKHARARHAQLDLRISAANELCVTIRDDGVGFDPERARQGLGLATIDADVEQWGGDWSIASRPGEGTSVHVVLPLNPYPAGEAGATT